MLRYDRLLKLRLSEKQGPYSSEHPWLQTPLPMQNCSSIVINLKKVMAIYTCYRLLTSGIQLIMHAQASNGAPKRMFIHAE